MRLSTEQLERLSDRVFRVLKASGHIGLDYIVDERVEERMLDTIMNILEDDSKTEDRLSREADRLVQQQIHIAKASGKTHEELVDEVKSRLAKSKRVTLGDGPDRADELAEKVFKAICRVDAFDFFSEEHKVQNCIARAINRFRIEDDRIVDAVEKLVSRKVTDEPYTGPWCLAYDKYFSEVKLKIAAGAGKSAPPEKAQAESL